MSTEALVPSEAVRPDGYPFHIGTRLVPTEDGRNVMTVPLTEDDFLHPQEEDRFMLNNAHHRVTHYLDSAIRAANRSRKSFRVFADHRIDWQTANIGAHGPDVVAFDRFTRAWNDLEGTLPVRDFELETLAVFEVTSESTRHIDYGPKFEEFAVVGVPYYLIVDVAEPHDEPNIHGFRLVDGQYRPMRRDPKLGFNVPGLHMWFRWENGKVIAADEDGKDIPDVPELFDNLESEAARADTEAARAAAEAARADTEAARAAAEAARADTEAARAAAEAARADTEAARAAAEAARAQSAAAERDAAKVERDAARAAAESAAARIAELERRLSASRPADPRST